MHQEIHNSKSNPKSLTLLSISSALFGIGCIMLGYIFLPFAVASYAALLRCENKNSRVFSYVIPIVVFAFNLLINGFFSLEGIIYVALGVILYLADEKQKRKSEIVFYLTALTSLFILLSALMLAFSSNESFDFGALKAFYAAGYDALKKIFITVMTAINTADDNGTLFFLFTRESAENIFHSLLLSIPSFIIIAAFLITGICYKFYNALKARFFSVSRESMGTYIPSKFFAVAYIAFAILSLFSSRGTDIFALTISNVNNVLMTVFAYFGFKILFSIFKATRGTFFSLIIFALAFLILSTTAITLLSFVGVFFALSYVELPKEH